jgi:hypothetical protein
MTAKSPRRSAPTAGDLHFITPFDFATLPVLRNRRFESSHPEMARVTDLTGEPVTVFIDGTTVIAVVENEDGEQVEGRFAAPTYPIAQFAALQILCAMHPAGMAFVVTQPA